MTLIFLNVGTIPLISVYFCLTTCNMVCYMELVAHQRHLRQPLSTTVTKSMLPMIPGKKNSATSCYLLY